MRHETVVTRADFDDVEGGRCRAVLERVILRKEHAVLRQSRRPYPARAVGLESRDTVTAQLAGVRQADEFEARHDNRTPLGRLLIVMLLEFVGRTILSVLAG